MIQVNELRIGNYLQIVNNICAVSAIYLSGFHVNDENGIDHNNHQSNISYIPLTEDILLKCKQYVKWDAFGEENFGGYIPFVDGKKLMIRYYKGNYFFNICSVDIKRNIFTSIMKIDLPIRYLHHLQNFIYSIKGEELTVNL